jgi:hypothetical protein
MVKIPEPPTCANCKSAVVEKPEFLCPPCKRGADKLVREYLNRSRYDVIIRGCLGSGMSIAGEMNTDS